MYIHGRGKIGYLIGSTQQPAEESSQYAVLDAENFMIMTWLVNSMEEEISVNYMCYSTAKELQDSVNEMYSNMRNKSQVYEIYLRIREIK